jgi:hypothetical protein
VQRHADASRSYLLVFLQKLLQEVPCESDPNLPSSAKPVPWVGHVD